ncbi:glycoside hydrolase family 6 protein [Streptomyces sp. NBC_00663]|uniref:glycoside hydrolase family 6 protein n=1 Tax=Streptomyces sp. NBC_00663 TaxID=2975801 RepID=UPI003FCD4B8D
MADDRYVLLAYAVDRFKRRPHTRVYLDAGNSGWIPEAWRLVAPPDGGGRRPGRRGRAQRPGTDSWCNPPGRALGVPPTTSTGHRLLDAYLWIKRPGPGAPVPEGRQAPWLSSVTAATRTARPAPAPRSRCRPCTRRRRNRAARRSGGRAC